MQLLKFSLLCGAAVASVQYDTIIVGGGLSGLGTAKALSEAGKSFIILEARNRTGGRVHNYPLPNGGYSEVGAEYLGPTQDKVLELAAELGLEIYESYDIGNDVLWHQGQLLEYPTEGDTGVIPPVDDVSLEQLFAFVQEIDTMALSIDVENPWVGNADWDQITFDAWLDERNLTETARFLIDISASAIWSVTPAEISLLYATAYIAAAGNETTPGTLERLLGTKDGAQMYRIDGGTELLATRLAEKLGNVQLNSPVAKISTRDEQQGYRVTLVNGTVVTGAHVVVAMSPPLAALITYEPPLPLARHELTSRMSMGAIGKGVAIYPTPWWRDDGLTGYALGDTGLGRITFDQTPKNAEWGAIMSFLGANEIRAYDNATEQEIIAQLTIDYTDYFGTEVASATSWVVFRWDNEEYSRGGPVAVAGPETYTLFGPALRQPVGNLHFAGTESSDFWVGYMDGALRSGYRAAAEVLAGN